MHVGLFITEEEAHAYDDEAYKLDPIHCLLNFPEDKINR